MNTRRTIILDKELDAQIVELSKKEDRSINNMIQQLLKLAVYTFTTDKSERGDADLLLIFAAAAWMAFIFLLGGLWLDGTLAQLF